MENGLIIRFFFQVGIILSRDQFPFSQQSFEQRNNPPTFPVREVGELVHRSVDSSGGADSNAFVSIRRIIKLGGKGGGYFGIRQVVSPPVGTSARP